MLRLFGTGATDEAKDFDRALHRGGGYLGQVHEHLRQLRTATAAGLLRDAATTWGAATVSALDSQVPYWDAAATTKTFTHPLHLPWLDGIDRHAAILDYGCGYGRTMAELEQHGYDNLTGVDTSPAMIERARRLHPTMRFAVLDTPPTTPYPNNSVDAILLFAVLTCIPSDEAQHRLVAELNRIHKPGGLLYISDLLLQDDDRNRRRYNHDGVFETSDGAICRHHSRERLSTLLTGFETVHTRTIPVTTMNGHESTGIQILAREPTTP